MNLTAERTWHEFSIYCYGSCNASLFLYVLVDSKVSSVCYCYRLVEEADFKSTVQLFAKKGGDDKTLDNFIPKSESDFMEYAEMISHKLRPFEVHLSFWFQQLISCLCYSILVL